MLPHHPAVAERVEEDPADAVVRYVSASEAKQRLAAVLDAAQREPVTIRRQNREVAVVISTVDYRRLTTTNVAEFQRFCNRVSEAARARGLNGNGPTRSAKS